MYFISKIWSYLLIFAFWIIFAFPYLFRGLIPMPSDYLVSFFPPWNAYFGMPVKNNAMPDIVTQIYPWKYLTIDTYKKGELPLWNPYSFSGTVHAGNYQSAIFSPVNILFFVFPFLTAWSFSVLLQPLFAGLFMNLFLKSMKRSDYSSVIGSIAFMFCGFLTTWMGYQTLGWSIVYLPLALFSVTKLNNSKNTWSGLLLSISVAASFYSGHYQISVYLLLATTVFFLSYLKSWKEKFAAVFYTLLGTFLAMPQLLVTLQALFNSDRSQSFTNGFIPWQYLSTILAPDFFGNPVTRNDWYGQYAEWSSYVGIFPLILALYALIKNNIKETKAFIFLLCLSTITAFASPFNSLIYQLKIPIISTSVATRIIVLFSFSMSVLSAFGLDYLRNDWKNKRSKTLIIVTLGLVLMLLILWGGIFVGVLPKEYVIIAQRNTILPTILILFFMISSWFVYRFNKLMLLASLIFIVCVGFDLTRFSSKWQPIQSRELVYPELPIITKLNEKTKYSRVFGTFGNELNTYFQIQSIEGYDAMYQKRYGEFISAAADGSIKALNRSVVQLDKQGIYTKQWLDLLGVKYILYRKSDGRQSWVFPHWKYPEYKTIHEDSKYEIIENINVLPRAYLASGYKVAKTDAEILSFLTSEEATSSSKIILEKEPSINPTSGPGSVQITSYTANSVELEVVTESPKLLYLSDVFDAGWKATVNNNPANIYRANFAFRAVEVSAGKSKVKFFYQPKEIIIGLFVAILSFSVLIGLSMRKLLYGRRNI